MTEPEPPAYKKNLDLLPGYMQGGMLRWIEQGILPGDFLEAVLRNDLVSACAQVDETNRHRLFDYIVYLDNYAPRNCYGSPEAVAQWKGLFLRAA